MRENKMWFEPKRFGYGAGLPIAWEGWAVYVAFVAIAALIPYVTTTYLTDAKQAAAFTFAGLVVIVALVIFVTRAKTKGGWRWRWGADD